MYVTHVEGKAHKKKLIQRKKEKSKWNESEKIAKEEVVTPPKITIPIPLRGNNDIIVANHNIPIISESSIENLASSSAESIIIQPPSVAKKKKKNKVNSLNLKL